MSRSLFCSLLIFSQALTFAETGTPVTYTFDAGKNILGDWSLPSELVEKLNNQIILEPSDEGLLVKTTSSNVRLTHGDDWDNFRVALTGRIEYPCSFELIGRFQEKPTPSYFFLRLDPSTKQIILGRFTNLKTEILQEATVPDSFKFRDFELALEFDGTNIRGYLNGEVFVDQLDDGSLPSGAVGIIGNYHTNLRLKSLEVSSPSGQNSSMVPPLREAKPSRSLATANPTVEETVLPLSLRDWNLSTAYKKKADSVRLSL